MTDPIAAAFSRIPVPEPSPDFESVVVVQVAPCHARRIQRRVFRVYWMAAGAVAAGTVAGTELTALVIVTGAAALAGIAAAAILAAGGIRSMTRGLRTTVG